MDPLPENPVKMCNRMLIFPRNWGVMGMFTYIGMEINNVVPSWVPF